MLLTTRGTITVILEERKDLVVELEQGIGMPGHRIVPTAGIPCPGNILFAQTIPNGRQGLGWDEMESIDIHRMGRVNAERSVDGVLIRCDRTIGHHLSLIVYLSNKVGRCIFPNRCAGANEPEVIQIRTTKSGMEEIIG